MLSISGMEDLKGKAVKISKATEFFNLVFKTTETALNPEAFSSAYAKRYAIKNGILSFIDEKNNWYLVPRVKGVVETLHLFGYIRADFYVPCTENNSYPIHKKEEWEEMLALV